ncbi:MAG: DUF423 domain-containing protein [Gammaproteobacteria bacterium]|nr:DUF423 domain-containing protein [Gammaproteobacteria bacterium]MBT3866587.1 DUF423 domain-containing protein [Gammaproteobacteria bacterium]MBT4378000.1 DUF423 domain-containing protein [Gammaproteobacteria bacterium]MBT4616055.1 DUF423 domain-containing protein [Gammaproteobacteria bacterium]MBT5199934.1 DUF423 domain-containing protein [Gammaproteobacteria bacterium]
MAFLFAAFAGALGVVLGAFGAHALRGSIEPRLIETFQTAVQYQLIHALALLLVSLTMGWLGQSLSFEISAYAFMAGIILFSGSLYGLVLTEMKWLGPVTPLGGLCLIVGWLALLVGGFRQIA